jgi:phage terminase large subunit-like protein
MPPKPKKDFAGIARQYCLDVISGKVPACGWVKKACQRHLDDLANDSVLWPYTFDPKKAHRACAFIELLPLVKGSQFIGMNLILQPWQCFIVCSLFGWVKKATGKRRFRKAYIEVPKGNGKSALMSAIALYMLALDGEPGAEIYSAAITKEQAGIVFKTAQEMARKCPKYLEKYGVDVAAHDIHLINDTLSVFRALASEADSLEGKNPHLACIDELHVHKTRTLYENLESAMGKRDNNLMLSITTAGSDRLGICYETRGHVIEILDKLFADETMFGIIYGLDGTRPRTSEPPRKPTLVMCVSFCSLLLNSCQQSLPLR